MTDHHEVPIVRMTVDTQLLRPATTAVRALGASIVARDEPPFTQGVTVLSLTMPDVPTGTAWVDIASTEERDPGEPTSRWISPVTYLDDDHRVIETRFRHVTVPITLDQIPEPLRGTRRP